MLRRSGTSPVLLFLWYWTRALAPRAHRLRLRTGSRPAKRKTATPGFARAASGNRARRSALDVAAMTLEGETPNDREHTRRAAGQVPNGRPLDRGAGPGPASARARHRGQLGDRGCVLPAPGRDGAPGGAGSGAARIPWWLALDGQGPRGEGRRRGHGDVR